jgi:hypothetical protein
VSVSSFCIERAHLGKAVNHFSEVEPAVAGAEKGVGVIALTRRDVGQPAQQMRRDHATFFEAVERQQCVNQGKP